MKELKTVTITAAMAVWMGANCDAIRAQEKEVTVALSEKASMKLILIPAGSFLMGSPEDEKRRAENEGPQHEVTISQPFYMGVTEVTQEQYEAVMGENPAKYEGPSKLPVECVSWNDATEFCRKLSEKTGRKIHLPTEAQWEYACRAGSKGRYCFGDSDEELDDYSWHRHGATGFTGALKTYPVGQKKPNAFGLYDMHGSVWEWCADWFAGYTKEKKVDPKGPDSGKMRVIRSGGSCGGGTFEVRSAMRGPCATTFNCPCVGFRVAMDTAEEQDGEHPQ